jgi:hypothetical protein
MQQSPKPAAQVPSATPPCKGLANKLGAEHEKTLSLSLQLLFFSLAGKNRSHQFY